MRWKTLAAAIAGTARLSCSRRPVGDAGVGLLLLPFAQ
jgi:hypothetical protein